MTCYLLLLYPVCVLQLYEIKYSNEVLEKGLSELEALYLRIQTGKVDDKNEGKENKSKQKDIFC